jgi:hypothetical protein
VRGGERRGAKHLQISIFASSQIGGIWRGREGSSSNIYYFYQIILNLILKFQNYPYYIF